MNANTALDPTSEEFRTHSAQRFRQLLREQPVARTTQGQWIICRHTDVERILVDRDHFERPQDWTVGRKPAGPLRDFGHNNMIGMNPPRHTRFRHAAAPAFAPGRIRAMRDGIERLVDDLIDRMTGNARGDFIRDFAAPLPIYVICELLGVPREDHDLFARSTAAVLASLEMTATQDTFDRGTAAAKVLFDYCHDIAAQRARQPREDLISLLLSRQESNELTRDEIVWIAVTMLIAGHETTTHMLGNGLLALLQHPDELGRLRADPGLTPGAIEESLRYDPTLYVLFRQTKTAVRIGDEDIPAGSFLMPSLYAANHDPAVFSDPDRFDITRANASRHLTFAGGQHLCLGLALARLEGTVALPRLLARLRTLELDGDPLPRNGLMFRGYLALPMRWQCR